MQRWRHLLYFTLIASLQLMHRYGCHKLGHAPRIFNANWYFIILYWHSNLTRKEIKQLHPQKYFKTTSFYNVFLNLYDFWNIAVSQGNTATYVKYGGLYNTYFVDNFVLSLPVKESWKSINFAKLSTWVGCIAFLTHSV